MGNETRCYLSTWRWTMKQNHAGSNLDDLPDQDGTLGTTTELAP